MNVRFDIDKDKQVITCTIGGPLNRDILMNLLTQLKIIVSNNQGCSLLMDLRETSLKKNQMDMHRVIDVVSAIVNMKSQLGDKVAHVVPVDDDRVVHAEDIGSVAAIRGIVYKVFTDLVKAQTWLTE
jgi:hypothetical protein